MGPVALTVTGGGDPARASASSSARSDAVPVGHSRGSRRTRVRRASSWAPAISASLATSAAGTWPPAASSRPRLWTMASACRTESWIWRASDSRSASRAARSRACIVSSAARWSCAAERARSSATSPTAPPAMTWLSIPLARCRSWGTDSSTTSMPLTRWLPASDRPTTAPAARPPRKPSVAPQKASAATG